MIDAAGVSQPFGQGWTQVAEFGIAFVLSGVIGLEREIRQKAAGLRTYTIVGVGAALFTLISKYGFTDVLRPGEVVLDPSRIAAQIVSGLGFVGAGVIFVQRGSVRGLTTAATVWLTAAVGAAAGAGLPVLAVLATFAYFLISYGVRPLVHRLPQLRAGPVGYRITYLEGRGLLRDLVNECTAAGYAIVELNTLGRRRVDVVSGADRTETGHPDTERAVEVVIAVRGKGDPRDLALRLAGVPGVLACVRSDAFED